MKITHVSLCGRYTDNLTYQDNLLPKYHKLHGHDVSMITSKYYINNSGKTGIDNRDVYINEHGVEIIGLKNKYFTNIDSTFKKYTKLYNVLKSETPDILFIHGCQFLDIRKIVSYLEKNPQVKVYVDNHADFSNSATNWLSKNILHKIIWKKCAQLIEPYTTKFYGVLPARVDFLQNVYNLAEEKTELLVMGADDEKVESANNPHVKKELREKFNINKNDFLIVTGGKIDNGKKMTLSLMRAVNEIPLDNIKLLVFGSVIPELNEQFKRLVDGNKVQYVGWIESDDSYNYFASADLAVFPGGHSVLWEQVVAQGIPLIVKQGENMSHIDFEGNIIFLHENTYKEIYELLLEIVCDKRLYEEMKQASLKDRKQFWYSNIARKSLELDA